MKDSDSPNKDFLVVGLGASAGGVQALRAFFSTMPPNSGMAFVVILHLSPQYESNLAAVLGAQTQMPVIQVSETYKVEPNHVYVILPNQQLEMIDGVVRPAKLKQENGTRTAIDVFFRTLADAYKSKAVCVVLSGTGSDGTLGLKRIKESNGFAVVQDPVDAEYDAMPRSAITTGLADWVLPVTQMPEKLIAFRESSERLHLTEDNPQKIAVEIQAEESLREILTILRVRTGHDFSNYKTPTLVRRIARHLQIHELEDIPSYLAFLREKPEEVVSLQRNLLINVTNFFRDKDAFETLEREVLPNLFANKSSRDTVRVWCAGCASGEEAYSLAILLSEYANHANDAPKLQIFATDVDDEAIAEAREHSYTEAIEADVSPERLKRFFIKEGNRYRIKKELRETVLFAPHNILRDPPFSKLDLITCRNLLIYLNRETQERVMEIFHFALSFNGYLFLGSSETAENVPNLFNVVDKKYRIYQRRASLHAQTAPPQMPVLGRWQVNLAEGKKRARETDAASSLGEVHYKLLERFAPPSVLVNQDFDVLYMSESVGRYLRFGGGEPSKNLLKLVHPELLPDLRAALFSAQRERKSSESQNIRLEIDGKQTLINLIVRAVDVEDESGDFLLVIFDEAQSEKSALSGTDREQPQSSRVLTKDNATEAVIIGLEEDLRRTRENLRATIEQHEISIEELKASNEELQAINEELRSASEELETSKEELQSVNEELITVNTELKEKIDETTRTNSDLQNLIAATNIATIFLDRNLRIKRYTPPVEEIFNITRNDTGRPLEHFTHQLNYEDLVADSALVLRKLTTIEREISDKNNRYYLARFLPYRTVDDRIDGVVLNFIDITERREIEDAMRVSEEKYRSLFDSIDEGFCLIEVLFDGQGKAADYRFLEINPVFERQSGLKNARGKTILELVPELEPQWAETYGQVARTGEAVRFEADVAAMNRVFDIYAFPGNAPDTVAVLFSDITERKRTESNLAFLAELSEDLVKLTTVSETMNALGAKLGEYFGLGHCLFFEIEEKEENVAIRCCWHRPDLPEIAGSLRIADFVELDFAERSRAGKTIVVRDLTDETVSDPERFVSLGIRSLVAVPLVQDGKWRFTLGAYSSEGRDWRDDEIELMREITTRIWTRLERARAEEALRESEENLRLLIESVKDHAIFTVDKQMRVTMWNSGAEQIFGWTADEIIGQSADVVFTPEDRENNVPEKEMETAMAEGRASDDRWHVRKNGSRFFVNGALMPLSDGGTKGFVKIARDLTAQQQVQETLRASEERLKLATEAAALGSWDWDFRTNRMLWSKELFEIFGLEPSADMTIDFENVKPLFHPEDLPLLIEKSRNARKNHESFSIEYRIRKANTGEERWVSAHESFFYDEENKPVRGVGIAQDITERKIGEEIMLRSRELLEIAVDERTKELATANTSLANEIAERQQISLERVRLLQQIVKTQEDERKRIARDMHDHLGQRLVALRLKLETLKVMCDGDIPLCDMVENAQKIAGLIDSDVDFISRELRPTSLDDLGLKVALDNYVSEWAEHFNIPAEFHAGGLQEKRLPSEVETHLYRITQEALNNAAKHSRATKADVLIENRDHTVILIIEDNGQGFEAEVLNMRRDKGLGLVGMKERALLMGGTLEIETGAGKGTTIFVRIPLNSK